MKRSFSIQATILISFLFVLIIACGSIIYYNYSNTSEAFMEDVESDINKAKATIINRVENYLVPAKLATQFIAWFSKNKSNVLDAAEDISVQSMKMLDLYPQIMAFVTGDVRGNMIAIERVDKHEKYPFGDEKALPENVRYEIRTINRNAGVATEFMKYIDKNGRTVALQERPRSAEYFDPRWTPWYTGAENAKEAYLSDPYIFTSSRNVGITAATPILSTDEKTLIVISADMTLKAISVLMKTHRIGKTGVTFVLNNNGDVVGYPDLKDLDNTEELTLPNYKDTKNEVLIQAFERYKATNETNFTLDHDGTKYIVRLSEFGKKFDKKWIIGFIVPQAELTGVVDNMTELMLIFAALILAFSAALIYIISRNIARPITAAANAMASIARFEIDDMVVKSSRFTEIQRMNKALTNMQQSLRDFSKFVPKSVVSKLMESGGGAKIGGKKRNISLMFTDIQGFTSISEQMSSEKLIVHLSDYLNQLTHIIQDNGGTIDKYIGDAIMSFWGAPVHDPNHPILACRSALACKARLEDLNKTWTLDGKPALFTRFGVHTGDAIVGNVGSEDRLNYSAFGDGVNLAEYLESINKDYGTTITISHETYKNVRHQFICRPTDVVITEGKKEGIPIYELLLEISEDDNKKLDMEAAQAIADLTTAAFQAYLSQDWNEATAKYKELNKLVPTDSLPKIFIERCKVYKKSPPGESWAGVYKTKK